MLERLHACHCVRLQDAVKAAMTSVCLQEDATKAVMKADGLQMGEHQISVAISNPPKRRTPLEQRSSLAAAEKTTTTTFTPTLGSGKKSDDTSRSERPRTVLAFQPRAVKARPGKAPVGNKMAAAGSKQNTEQLHVNDEGEFKSAGLSNEQFRNMLFKKNEPETDSKS